MGYVKRAGGVDERYLADALFEIEIGGVRATAHGTLRPPYDPDGVKIRS
jgi:hypothetical protein